MIARLPYGRYVIAVFLAAAACCGGVRADGNCEVKPDMRCVWVEAYHGSERIAGGVESMTMGPMTGNKISASPEAMRRVASVYTPKDYSFDAIMEDLLALAERQRAATRA